MAVVWDGDGLRKGREKGRCSRDGPSPALSQQPNGEPQLSSKINTSNALNLPAFSLGSTDESYRAKCHEYGLSVWFGTEETF